MGNLRLNHLLVIFLLGSVFSLSALADGDHDKKFDSGRTRYSSADVDGRCTYDTSRVNSIKSEFDRCRSKQGSKTKGSSLIVDLDNKRGYLYGESGRVDLCFEVTIGSVGIGNGVNETAPGMFKTSFQNGEKYQTNAKNDKKKGINIGNGGKILHSAKNGKTTAGCIGIEDKYWMNVFKQLGTDGAPVYAFSEKHKKCDPGKKFSKKVDHSKHENESEREEGEGGEHHESEPVVEKTDQT